MFTSEKPYCKAQGKELKARAHSYLQNTSKNSELKSLISVLETNLAKDESITQALLVIELVFTELFRRYETVPNGNESWQLEYEAAFSCACKGIDMPKVPESVQSLVTAMKLIGCEAKATKTFPLEKLRMVLERILSSDSRKEALISRYSDYSRYPDILSHSWKILSQMTPKGSPPNEIYSANFLQLVGVMPITKETTESEHFCMPASSFPYQEVRKALNKIWSCVILWRHNEETLKQLLIILLEKILIHLDKPILLTDFLMESLDMGGAIGLLALQGIFILIQKHNLTYPNIYEKLYSMFEPEIFHTKFKARLFYLADIFLSSSHLPEALVAAFAKRLARLALVAPPQDIPIILYFVGNLILRHAGLHKLLYHKSAGFVSRDPFIMEESNPLKSQALESQLWEIHSLWNHGIPSVALAAKVVSNPQSQSIEWDLSNVLEVNENDIFDQEISRKTKEYALSFERPMSMFLPKSDRTLQFWNLV